MSVTPTNDPEATAAAGGPPATLVREARLWGAAALAASALLAWLQVRLGVLEARAAAAGPLALALALVVARARLGAHRPHARLGPANAVTLGRAVVVALFLGLALDPPSSAALQWGLVALAIATLVLDGVDGRLARTSGAASPFGAWADQEVDAAFVVALCVFTWREGEAGAWILAAGAWRYAFLVAVAALPRLRGELAPSFRRKLVCIVQLGVLVACISPLFEAPASTALAAGATLLLSWSFAVDLVALWRR